MEKIKNGFWDYAEKWRDRFPEDKNIRWKDNWIENGWCANCRYCCGPQDSDTPFPMPLLNSQANARSTSPFHLLDCKTAYLAAAGCKADGSGGCMLALAEKPISCGLFPIVFANGALYLYQHCPAVIYTPLFKFMELARMAAKMLMDFTYGELLHLSICLNMETLAKNYIYLHIILLQDGKKRLIFD